MKMLCNACKSRLNRCFDADKKPDAKTLEHLAHCKSCNQFYRNLLDVQLRLAQAPAARFDSHTPAIKTRVLSAIDNGRIQTVAAQHMFTVYMKRTAIAACLCGVLVLTFLARPQQSQTVATLPQAPDIAAINTYASSLLTTMVEVPLEKEMTAIKRETLFAASRTLNRVSAILSQFDETNPDSDQRNQKKGPL